MRLILSTVIAAVLLLAGVQPFVGQDGKTQPTLTAQGILDRAIKAQGGEKRLARMRSMTLRLNARVVVPGEGESPFQMEITYEAPDKYRSVINFVRDLKHYDRTIVLNGGQGWVTLNGVSREMNAKEVREFKEQMYAETLCRLLPLRDKEQTFTLKALDETKIEEHPVLGIQVTSKDHGDVNLYFEKATGLLVKMQHVVTHPANGQECMQDVYFINYRTTAGPHHWGRFVVYNDYNRVFDGEVIDVQFHEKANPRLFARPRELPAKSKSESANKQ